MVKMKFTGMALVLGFATSLFVGAVPQVAQSQTLFEMIFKNPNRRNFRQPQFVPPPPVKIKKVSAPKYFGYRAAAMKKVNFAPLAKALVQLRIDNSATGSTTTEPTSVNEPQPHLVELENQDFIDAVANLRNSDIRVSTAIGKAVVSHYIEHPSFIWVAEGKPTFSSQLTAQLFEKSGEIGLNPGDYRVDIPHVEGGNHALAEFEMKMSMMAVRYALDARNGKINPNKLSGYHDFPKSKYNAVQAISEIASDISPSGYLAAASPTSENFLALKATLASLQHASSDIIVIAPKTLIKPGKFHPELPNVVAAIRRKGSIQLLQRHGEVLTSYSKTELYTDELVALVKDFQAEKKLKPDGVIGPNTISRMVDVDPKIKMQRVRLAMERLRWHPRRLGSRHVFINQPAYRARYFQGGKEKLSMRVIVGKRSNQTSFFYDSIERVEFNPYWGVPQSIIINEMLPKLRADPSYLDARGYEVTTVSGQQISSSSINWSSLGGGQVPYNVRQLPGAKNALGELKILFPNKHAIYMHDTPSRGLFKRSKRALSHGCVRLHDPRGMAAAVLGTSVSHISSKINLGKNNAQKLKSRIPVYIAYFTAWPNKDGKVEFFSDIYGRDRHLNKAMDKLAAVRSKSA